MGGSNEPVAVNDIRPAAGPRPRRVSRYRADLTGVANPSFSCGAFAFDLDLLVAISDGQTVTVRPQEARLLSLLLQHAGRIVDYPAIRKALYGDRIDADSGRARLKSLVADVRRRFGMGMQSALLTATGKGLLLNIEFPQPEKRHQACSSTIEECRAAHPMSSQCMSWNRVRSDETTSADS